MQAVAVAGELFADQPLGIVGQLVENQGNRFQRHARGLRRGGAEGFKSPLFGGLLDFLFTRLSAQGDGDGVNHELHLSCHGCVRSVLRSMDRFSEEFAVDRYKAIAGPTLSVAFRSANGC